MTPFQCSRPRHRSPDSADVLDTHQIEVRAVVLRFTHERVLSSEYDWNGGGSPLVKSDEAGRLGVGVESQIGEPVQ